MSPLELDKVKEYLALLEAVLTRKLAWGNLEDWRYSQFKELSAKIEERTGTSVSYMTLTRILQERSFKRSPQQATLDALAKFVEYRDWEEFCFIHTPVEENEGALLQESEHKVPTPHTQIEPGEPASISPRLTPLPELGHKPKTRLRRSYLLLGVSGLCLGLLGLWLWKGYTSHKQAEIDASILLEQVSEVQIFPSDLLFRYKVPGPGYSYWLKPLSYMPKEVCDTPSDFARLKPVRDVMPLSEHDSIISLPRHRYPGLYEVLILKGDEIKARAYGNLFSDGWLGFIMHKKKGGYRDYAYLSPKIADSGLLTLPPSFVDQVIEKPMLSNYESNFFNVRDFGIEGNRMTVETRIRINYVEDVVDCHYMRITLQTTNGMVEMPVTQAGCSKSNLVWVSEQNFSFTEIGHRLYEKPQLGWETVRIELKDMKARFMRNDTLIDEIPYKYPLGDLYGLRIRFRGMGEVDYVRITDTEGNLIYQDEFEEEEESDIHMSAR